MPIRARAAGAVLAVLVLAGCGRQERPAAPAAARAALRPLPELRAQHGVLRATWTLRRASYRVAGRRVRGKTYAGGWIGPTLRVHGGDTIELSLRNALGQPTNLHTHGFHVSPIGISDNVLRTMPGGSTSAVRIHTPRHLSPGTYWYHAHLHGLTEEQVFTGLSGVLVVEGLRRRLPAALRNVPDRVLALKDLQVRRGAIVSRDIDSNAPTIRTVNGQLRPEVPVRTNRTQLLRLANVGADIWYRLRLDGARFHVVAEDANPVGRVWTARELVLPPGKRFDVLVCWPRPGAYRLRTLRFGTGPWGDRYPERVLARVRVSGAPARPVAWPRSLGPTPRLDRERVDRVRRLVFSENPRTGAFFIDGKQFDPSRVNQVVRLGALEEWRIRNASRELHPFHIHVNDFQVVAVNGRRVHAPGLQDVVPLPVRGEVRIRMRFRDYLGAFVYHCHILAHEDAGMMGVVDVTRTGRRPSRATRRALAGMRRAMRGMPTAGMPGMR